MVPISQRPDSVLDRTVEGHWEVICWSAATMQPTVTLAERHSRYLLVLPLLDDHPHRGRRRHGSVPAATTNHAPIPTGPRRRNDAAYRLHRRHRHPGLLLRRRLPVQRGSNENSNGLLRNTS